MNSNAHAAENGSPAQAEAQQQPAPAQYDQASPEQNELSGEDFQDGEQPQWVSSALADTRIGRKQAQEDVQKLANRIALLKMEEKKAWKKIEEHKKKCNDLVNARTRHIDQQKNKQDLENQRKAEEAALRDRNNQLRDQMKSAINYNQKSLEQQRTNEAERLKQERLKNAQSVRQQKIMEEQRAAQMSANIKQTKAEQVKQREMEKELKRLEMRQDLINRINEENMKRMQISQEVARLSNEEAEWINKLQNTQQLHVAAEGELDSVCNGPPGGEM